VGFAITRRTPLDALEVWARLTDWEAHSGLIPFTRISLPLDAARPAVGVGSRFVARTTLGPVQFDDPMEVTFWRPPGGTHPGEVEGVCRIVKRGRVVVGWAVLTVSPGPASGESTVSWMEEADLRLGGPLLRRPTALLGRAVFTRLLDQLLVTSN
jgi:hypothetical protein